MRHRTAAYLAAAWAIAFAAPHVYWATGRTDGLGTALSDQAVRGAGLGMAISCAAIALFCLCGAATALATVRDWPGPMRRPARRVLIGLTWFGAVLLLARSVDIYVEFNLSLTGLLHVPAGQHADFLHLSRWFMFCYGPWFALGAIAWTRLAWRYTTSPRRVDQPADQGRQADTMRAIAPRSGGMAESR
jgi:Protein of unknown function (DUF3995)